MRSTTDVVVSFRSRASLAREARITRRYNRSVSVLFSGRLYCYYYCNGSLSTTVSIVRDCIVRLYSDGIARFRGDTPRERLRFPIGRSPTSQTRPDTRLVRRRSARPTKPRTECHFGTPDTRINNSRAISDGVTYSRARCTLKVIRRPTIE